MNGVNKGELIMEFLKLNNELVNLKDLFNVSKNDKERIIKLTYNTDGKLITYELDYSDVKDDVNEEKTIIEKDFEKIEKYIFKEVDPEVKRLETRIKDLEFGNSISRDLKERYRRKIEAITKVIHSGKLKKTKLIKEIIEDEKF